MNIIYEDEYGNEIYKVDSNFTPSQGDTVVLDNEDWQVKSRSFYPALDTAVISLTQTLGNTPRIDHGVTDSRLNEMKNAIMAVNKRQHAVEQKGVLLSEQISTIRTHINQDIKRNNRKETKHD